MTEAAERHYQDIGQDEAWSVDLKQLVANEIQQSQEVQATGLESIKRNRAYVDKVLSDAQQFDNQRQVIANQALQNAVETANAVSKQMVRHGDLAIDRQWNIDEQVWATVPISALADQIATKVAEKVKK